jgi:transposase
LSGSRGKAVYRKKFTRPKLIEFLATCPATTIAMEACGGSHFMARKLEELGHFPKLISPQFVRPFVKSNKNDFVDAEAICEAASRPSMRFVQPRTESQQAMRALHRVRESPGSGSVNSPIRWMLRCWNWQSDRELCRY